MAAPRKDKLTGDFEEYLLEELQDPEFASEYLNAAIEDGDIRVFLMALGDIAKATGMSKISRKTGLNRENIYRIVSDRGNPQIKSVVALLAAVGLRITTEPAANVARPKLEVYSYSCNATVQTGTEPNQLDPITPKVDSVSFITGDPGRLPSAKASRELACAA